MLKDYADMLETLEARCAAANPEKPGDYYENGLLHCGLCRTPKQGMVTLFGKPTLRTCMCRCAKEAWDREQRREAAEKERARREDLRSLGFPDAELRSCVFDRADGAQPRLSKLCRRYVERFDDLKKEGKGLLLYGPVGTGKTFAAACVVNALIDRGYPCLMTNFTRLGNTLSAPGTDRQACLDSLARYDLVVIDDLAAERDTEYMSELVFILVDARCRQGLPLIVTTNITGEELKNPAQVKRQRTYSRLLEMCYPVEVPGKDRRKTKLREEFGRYQALLEG